MHQGYDSKEPIKECNKSINKIMASNLKFLMGIYGHSENDVSKLFGKRNILLHQGQISKYLNEYETNFISVSAIINICEIYGITFYNFIDPDFAQKYTNGIVDKNTTVSNTASSLFDDQSDLTHSYLTQVLSFGEYYVYKASHPDFSGIYGKYYTYFYPTKSDESEVLHGELTFFEEDNVCKAEFLLHTYKINEKTGKPLIKKYTGILIKAGCYSCILRGLESYNEICLLNFRYIKLNAKLLDCRVAEVLTSAAGEDQHPTVHRMLISRNQIQGPDLDMVMPQMKLGSEDIMMTRKDFMEIKQKSDVFYKILDKINLGEPLRVHVIREDIVRSLSNDSHLDKKDLFALLAELRRFSIAERYNKVSKKLDDNVRGLLISKGYFSN